VSAPVSATAFLGSLDPLGLVVITASPAGDWANGITVAVSQKPDTDEATETTAHYAEGEISVGLGTDENGDPDTAKATPAVVAAAISAIAEFSAAAHGTAAITTSHVATFAGGDDGAVLAPSNPGEIIPEWVAPSPTAPAAVVGAQTRSPAAPGEVTAEWSALSPTAPAAIQGAQTRNPSAPGEINAEWSAPAPTAPAAIQGAQTRNPSAPGEINAEWSAPAPTAPAAIKGAQTRNPSAPGEINAEWSAPAPTAPAAIEGAQTRSPSAPGEVTAEWSALSPTAPAAIQGAQTRSPSAPGEVTPEWSAPVANHAALSVEFPSGAILTFTAVATGQDGAAVTVAATTPVAATVTLTAAGSAVSVAAGAKARMIVTGELWDNADNAITTPITLLFAGVANGKPSWSLDGAAFDPNESVPSFPARWWTGSGWMLYIPTATSDWYSDGDAGDADFGEGSVNGPGSFGTIVPQTATVTAATASATQVAAAVNASSSLVTAAAGGTAGAAVAAFSVVPLVYTGLPVPVAVVAAASRNPSAPGEINAEWSAPAPTAPAAVVPAVTRSPGNPPAVVGPAAIPSPVAAARTVGSAAANAAIYLVPSVTGVTSPIYTFSVATPAAATAVTAASIVGTAIVLTPAAIARISVRGDPEPDITGTLLYAGELNGRGTWTSDGLPYENGLSNGRTILGWGAGRWALAGQAADGLSAWIHHWTSDAQFPLALGTPDNTAGQGTGTVSLSASVSDAAQGVAALAAVPAIAAVVTASLPAGTDGSGTLSWGTTVSLSETLPRPPEPIQP